MNYWKPHFETGAVASTPPSAAPREHGNPILTLKDRDFLNIGLSKFCRCVSVGCWRRANLLDLKYAREDSNL